MKNAPALLLLALAISISSCSNKKSDCISVNKDGIPVIEIEKITEKGELSFTDLMKDFQITRLETNEECLVDDVFRRYVTEDYIIVGTSMNGIMLFGRDGKFIRKITGRGTGPGEVIGSYHLEYNELTQSLIIASDYYSAGFLKAFKLPGGKFSKIKINTDGTINDFLVSDSLIILSPLSFEDSCRVISQTLSGRELFRINHSNDFKAYYANVYLIDNKLMFNYSHGGNKMYYIESGELVPHSIYSFKGNMYTGIQQDIGDVLLFLMPLNTNMVRGIFSRVSGHESFDNSDFKRATFDEYIIFIFNKSNGSAYLIDKIKDDFLGSDKTIESIQSNGLFSQIYEVQELFNLRDLINDDPEASVQIKKRLNSLCDQLDPNDNPVFLIAKTK
ncbi:MAG: 6-bladed beta-propeller [Marinilabiliaceae bacterium]|jgi:hypothetical protein|nr:6-bladed beta-propeller [Marinilabiliaceae bacterium]